MVPYLWLLSLSCLLGLGASSVREGDRRLFLVLIVLLLALFSGLRGNVGSDTPVYVELYETSPPLSEFMASVWRVEPGYLLLNSLHKTVFDSAELFMLFFALFQAFLIYKLCQRAASPVAFLLFYIFVFYFYYHLNILRAGTSLLLFVLALSTGSTFYRLLLFVAAVSFHISAIILIPFLLLGRSYSIPKLAPVLGVIGGLSIAFFYLFFDRVVLKIETYLVYLGSNGFGSPLPFLIFVGLFLLTLVVKRGAVSTGYRLSGLALASSFLLVVFAPGFYRISNIFLFLYFWYALEEFRSSTLSFKFVVASYLIFQSLSVGYTAYTETERLQVRLEAERVSGHDPNKESLDSTYIPYEFFWQKD